MKKTELVQLIKEVIRENNSPRENLISTIRSRLNHIYELLEPINDKDFKYLERITDITLLEQLGDILNEFYSNLFGLDEDIGGDFDDNAKRK